jgi:uncharacterized protein YbcV (DUF1398 family)
MTKAAIKEAVHRADNAASYPEVAQILIDAGVRLYHTDVRSHTIIYNTDQDYFADQGEPAVPDTTPPADVFDQAGIVAAFASIERREVDYQGFLRQLWRAGVVEYEVSLIARRITYYGAHGETHSETIPEPRQS